MLRLPMLWGVCLSSLSLPTSLSAQQEPQADKRLQARNFFFDNYSSVATVDVQRLRELGILDELHSSLMEIALAQMEQSMGFSVDALNRVSTVSRWNPDDLRMQDITVMESASELPYPKELESWRWTMDKLGSWDILRRAYDQSDIDVHVHKTLRVSGPEQFLRPVLQGKPRAGLPSADLMSLSVGAKNLLGYVVMDLRESNYLDLFCREMLPDAKWPEGDRPTFLCLRLRATGDEDDPHLALDLVVRHKQAGEGVAATHQAIDAALQAVRKDPRSRLFRPLLKKIESKVDGMDARWDLDLGRSRMVVGGMITTLLPFVFLASEAQGVALRAAQVIEVTEEEIVVEEPPPPPVPKPAPKPRGNGGNH